MNDESAHPAEKGGLPTKEGLAAQTGQAGAAEEMKCDGEMMEMEQQIRDLKEAVKALRDGFREIVEETNAHDEERQIAERVLAATAHLVVEEGA